MTTTALRFLPEFGEPVPRLVGPSQVDIGDLVELKNVELPVIITSGGLEGEVPELHRAFEWISQARKSTDEPVLEGRGIHDCGEPILLLAKGETVPASQVEDGDVLLLEGHASPYGLVVGTPKFARPGVLDIPWRAGVLPSGMPQVVGALQMDPSAMVRRAPRAVAA